MADAVKLEIRGLSRLRKKLGRAASKKWIKSALEAQGEHIKGKASQYPRQRSISRASIYGTAFVSDRQRKYFFAALRSGDIQVPYKRNKQLSKKWYVKSKGYDTVEIGNPLSYAQWVHGEKQSKMMAAIGWKQLEATAKKELPGVTKRLQEQLNEILED